MSLLYDMTREEVRRIAPQSIALLPTASIEQHGPHLPICTDSLLCETVAQRAAKQASGQAQVVVAPILYYGNSHHHFPFPGVLSLTSQGYITTVTEILESLARSGFRKLVVLNGHGGNTQANVVLGRDLVNRLGYQVSIATAAYWDIARGALVERGFAFTIPGHAGRFETDLVMAIRPELVDKEALAKVVDVSANEQVHPDLAGAAIQDYGTWGASTGYTDNPALASAAEGQECLEIIVQRVSAFLVAYYQH